MKQFCELIRALNAVNVSKTEKQSCVWDSLAVIFLWIVLAINFRFFHQQNIDNEFL